MFFGGVNDETAIIDRPGQLKSLDFVGCIRSVSINGNEKNLHTQALNSSGLKDTCNYVGKSKFKFKPLPLDGDLPQR